MADKRQGIAFQNFVAMVERVFANGKGVVESPKFIRDKSTGELREFDIFITTNVGYHTMTTAIEVKDEARPVGIGHVEQFNGKCDRNGIGRKVMVSSSGFREPARKLAGDTNVTLMELKDAEAFDWISIDKFLQFRRVLDGGINIEVFFPDDVAEPPQPWTFAHSTGEPLSFDEVKVRIEETLAANEVEDDLGNPEPRSVRVLLAAGIQVVAPSGELVPVKQAIANLTYHFNVTPMPIKLQNYVGEGVSLSLATGDMDIGDTKGKLVLAKQEDGRIAVQWHPVDPPKPEKAERVATRKRGK